MKLKYLLLAIAGLSMFTSCETDEPSLIVAQYQKPTTFVLNTPQFANGVYDLQNAGALNLTFSQPDYGYSAVCKYTIELSKTEDFATPVAMSTTYSVCDIDIDANDFAMSVCTTYGWESQADIDAALAEAGGTVPVYVRVKSQLSNTQVKDSEITSNSVKLNVIPYFALPAVELPTTMYMIGNFCGWEWSNAAEMVPVHSNPDKFWCIRYVAEGEGFKFNTKAEWGGDFGYEGTTLVSNVEGLEFAADNDKNITVNKSGWYIFGVSVALSGRDLLYTVTVFPANVYVYGACTGLGDNGWSDMPEWTFVAPETADGDFVSPALAATGELRLCIHPLDLEGNPWAGDWWHTEFIFFDGKIAYRGTGGDQERVTANQGLKVYLNFVTGRASVK